MGHPSRACVVAGILFVMAVASVVGVDEAFAIPSPELIVSSIGSLSQLGAMAAALFGGGAAFSFLRRGGTAARTSVGVWRVMVGAIVLSVLFGGLNIYQWHAQSAEREARLSATLVRPSRLPGQRSHDKSLKELSAAEQATHPLGLTTAEAERLIPRAEEEGYVLIDIREAAEVEMGTFLSAKPIRYPDLLQSGADLKGRKALLICHNGNRSSESCQALAARGIDCRFIVGGLERWITEGRRAGGFYRSSLSDTRALPSYDNNRRLIDTAEARSLIETEKAVVVDVRYPGDFAIGHLPSAINLPMRRMTTKALEEAIAALPAGPILVPCYERRSCFFGEVLGLALTRGGRDFRGRYTLPWEYTPTPKVPGHVAAALAESQIGFSEHAVRWLSEWLHDLAEQWGFLTVLIGLAIVSRLVILPFAVKADRDQMVAAMIEPDVQRIKKTLGDDPSRRARALAELFRQNGMTPVRNLVALLGLPILAMAASALAKAAELGQVQSALFGAIYRPDESYILPSLFAMGVGGYVHWVLAKTRRARLLVWLVAVPALGVAMAFVPGAVSLYALISLGLILLQRLLLAWWMAWQSGPKRVVMPSKRALRLGIVRLGEAARLPGIGGKAEKLGQLVDAGVPVPRGVVLTPNFIAAWTEATPRLKQLLARQVARAAGRGPYAVRSSAQGEDASDASHAGVFETVTDVERDGLGDAIDQVLKSYTSNRAASYAFVGSGPMGGGPGGGIVVQRMIKARYAGVLFTRAPDAAGLALVEMVEGAGEALVSGQATPQSFRFGRKSGAATDDVRPPIDLGPLLALGRGIESYFGRPQDIEWVFAEGRFAIVQTRDITTEVAGTASIIVAEWNQLLEQHARAKDVASRLVRNEVAEMLPTPTVATHALFEALHAPGGSVDLACRRLGIAYNAHEGRSLFPLVFGRLYVDQNEADVRAPRLARWQIRRIVKGADDLERHVRDVIIPGLADRATRAAALDYLRLETPMLLAMFGEACERFVRETHVEAEVVNIVADLCLREAKIALANQGLDAAALLVRSGESLVEKAVRSVVDLAPVERHRHLVRELGHRAHVDYELGDRRFAECHADLAAFADTYAMLAREHCAREAHSLPLPLAEQVERARRLQTLKEDAKHAVLTEIAELRRLLLALDERLGFRGHIFHLTLDEIGTLSAERLDALRAVAIDRAARRDALLAHAALPARLSLEVIEVNSWPGRAAAGDSADRFTGVRVAGGKEVEAAAYVIDQATAEAGRPLDDFPDGNILVAPFIHPAWLGAVLRSGGVVSDTGGWLSHMAIVARERDVPMIVGVRGWRSVVTGERLRLGLDGKVARAFDAHSDQRIGMQAG